jgi:O-antigen ligase
MNVSGRVATGVLWLLPGAMTIYFSFNAGGFFPDSVAVATLVLSAVLGLRMAIAEAPFEGFGVPLVVAAGGLAVFGLWTLLSGRWSDAPGRALIEFDRVLLYLMVLVVFGSLGRTQANVRWMLRGLALGIAAVCVTGLATRLLPDVFPIAETLGNDRLNYPLTYWNALGLLASVGAILCFHFASSRSEPPAIRVLGTAAVPLLATTAYFTFSRGAIAAGIVGLITYVALGRPRALLSGLLATAPATVAAVVFAYQADLLATGNPTTQAAADQGHDVAIALSVCVAVAVLLRIALLPLDARLSEVFRSARISPRVRVGAGVAAAAAAITLVIALDVPGELGDQYDRFVDGSPAATGGDLRTRLTNPANNGRIQTWDVATDAFTDKELAGTGAGTYQNVWAANRPIAFFVRDAHSLYVEALAELGIVGFSLLATAILAILATLLVRVRKAHRSIYAALFAASMTWAIHAGLDWDWEMPAVTLWFFALGGAALAASGEARRRSKAPSAGVRVLAVFGCFAVAIVPGLVLVSQTRLDDASGAFARGDCPAAVDAADESIAALGNRSEPYEIRGFCRIRAGSPARAVADLQEAVDRDPDDWTYRYDLALAQGAAGLDPRQEAREAARLNPFNADAQAVGKRLRGNSPATWRREARAMLRDARPFYLSER